MHTRNDKKPMRNLLRTRPLPRHRALSCVLTLAVMFSLFVLGCTAQTAQEGNKNTTATPTITTTQQGDDVVVTPIMHASLQLEFGGKVIHIDPTSAGDYTKAKQADLILVTDIHGDHLDPAAITRIRKPGAPVVAPAAAAPKIENPTTLANGKSKSVAGFSLEAVPMYNLKRGPSEGRLFHTKGRGNGYILTLGSKRVYIAGDTECTPEMRALKNIDIAFIPMNLPYTMPPSEAAECVKAFKPKVVYPYHYRGQKPEEFKAALAAEPIEVRLLEWYPKGSDK
jgi:L-ascorbate metabolism protein UlaG (beta-lactamase superfamily)